MNDEDTLRKEGSRTDVYEVLTRMLECGDMPSTIDELTQASIDPPAMKNKSKSVIQTLSAQPQGRAV